MGMAMGGECTCRTAVGGVCASTRGRASRIGAGGRCQIFVSGCLACPVSPPSGMPRPAGMNGDGDGERKALAGWPRVAFALQRVGRLRG